MFVSSAAIKIIEIKMISKCSLVVVVAVMHFVFVDAKADNCTVCAKTPKHYQELGCVGKLDENGCCYDSYECPDLSILDSSKCHLKGLSFEIEERIPISHTPLCSHTCLCAEEKYESPPAVGIQCAYSECPSLFKPKLNYKNCIFQHDSSGCCRIRKICGDKDVRKLAKCTLDGRTYREGEKMFPRSSSCHYCLCSSTFDETIAPASNEDCKLIDCEMEIIYFHELRKGCVPVYYSSSCCPIRFRCPTEDDEVLLADVARPGKTCRFGDLNLYVGQQLSPDDTCVECTCKVPPMVDCVRKEICNR